MTVHKNDKVDITNEEFKLGIANSLDAGIPGDIVFMVGNPGGVKYPQTEVLRINGEDGRIYDSEGRDLFERFLKKEHMSGIALAAYEHYFKQDHFDDFTHMRGVHRIVLLELIMEVMMLKQELAVERSKK